MITTAHSTQSATHPTGDDVSEGASCKPNISAAGRKMRRRFGVMWAAITVVAAVTAVVLGAPWYVRALAGFPAALSAIGFLQAARNTCVMRAREGTFERGDLSKIQAPDADVAASRHVASAILRDAVLIGVVAGAVAATTVLLG